MKKLKEILTNALYGMLRSYEGKRFVPSLIIKLVMSLASAVITAFFANTLFSRNNTANQIFAALFFYFLITAASNLITEIKRGGFGKRLKTALGNMVRLKPTALWFRLRFCCLSRRYLGKIPCCSALRTPSQVAKAPKETVKGLQPLQAD